MRHIFSSLIMICAVGSSAHAQDEYLPNTEYEKPMSAEDVKQMFSGQTHRGTYNFQMQNFEGYNFEETTFADGRTLHRLGSRTDTGTWEQNEEQICFDYDAPDLTPACFIFYRRGNCVYHYQQSVQGYSTYGFTAVSVIKGESPNCEAPMV